MNHLIRRVIAKDRDAFLILIGVLIMVFAAILDTLDARNVFVFPGLVGILFYFLF
ncbi:hypothetical protein LEP1GSC088_1651 [Leptospira interrogans str. L1207]|nr:hypothetical protein LEP1GSC088_1651 [Leptospira interrogans str. L1207]